MLLYIIKDSQDLIYRNMVYLTLQIENLIQVGVYGTFDIANEKLVKVKCTCLGYF